MKDAGPVKVKINLKHGSNRIYDGLGAMHNSTMVYNADMTWLDAFYEHFGLRLDPRRFTVRRVADGSSKHNLNEAVRILIGEFQRGRTVYSVQLFENQQRRTSNSNTPKTGQSFGSAKGSKAPVAVTQTGHSQRMSNSAQSSRATIATTRIKAKRGATEMVNSSRGASPRKNQKDLSQPRHSRIVKKPKISGASPTPPGRRPQSMEEEVAAAAAAVDMEDFDDACSVYTNATQNSQDDLEEQGIEYKPDLQAKVIATAKCLSNGQLSQARNDLLKLKATGSIEGRKNKWTTWCMTCPMAVTLIRELLDV